jgi:hypothetical protein
VSRTTEDSKIQSMKKSVGWLWCVYDHFILDQAHRWTLVKSENSDCYSQIEMSNTTNNLQKVREGVTSESSITKNTEESTQNLVHCLRTDKITS